MKPELYQEIALKQDFPKLNLYRGDIATLIDYVPSPTGDEEGAILCLTPWESRSLLSRFRFPV